MQNKDNYMVKIIISKKYNEELEDIVPWYIFKRTINNKTYIGEGYSQMEANANLQKSYDAELYK